MTKVTPLKMTSHTSDNRAQRDVDFRKYEQYSFLSQQLTVEIDTDSCKQPNRNSEDAHRQHKIPHSSAK